MPIPSLSASDTMVENPAVPTSCTTEEELNKQAEDAVNADVNALIESYDQCYHDFPKKIFATKPPNDLTFYVQPSYDFFHVVAGIDTPGIEFQKPEGSSNDYTVTARGPVTGWSPGPEASFGLDFRRYSSYTNERHPHWKLYEQKGPRLSLQAAFGSYQMQRYQFEGTASLQQIADKWGYTEQDLTDAAGDALSGDFGGLAGLLKMIPTVWGSYDFSKDFYGDMEEVDYRRRYFRTGATFWIGNSIFNASKPVNFMESTHFGVSANYFQLGKDPYFGMGLNAEASLIRFSPKMRDQHFKGELLLTASGGYYHGVFGEKYFWDESQQFLTAQTGAVLRISTDIPNKRDLKRGAKAVEQGVKNLSETPPEPIIDPGF